MKRTWSLLQPNFKYLSGSNAEYDFYENRDKKFSRKN